jgi:hypothetical protein
MGILRTKVGEDLKKQNLADYYKNNTIEFLEKYRSSDNDVSRSRIENIQFGRFYFFQYRDDSKWMQYSPVFTIDFKKFENLIIMRAINLNFIPFDIRVKFFDNFMVEKDLDQDRFLRADYTTVYDELFQIGFEWTIMEYNMSQMVVAHKINMSLIPKFLYSGHPEVKYDPRKLYEIWQAKLKTKYQRDQEMTSALIKDFYQVSEQIDEKYVVLKKHIQRLQNSLTKYGRSS